MQNNQKVALKALGSFFFGIFLLTLISRGADSLTTPQVETSNPRGGKINYEVQAEGQLHTKSQEQLYILEGFNVKEIFVEEGDVVASGDKLFALDTVALKKALDDQQHELKKMILQMEQLQLQRKTSGGTSPVKEAQKTLEQIEEEHQYLMAQEQVKIGRIEQALEEAEQAMEAAQKDLDTFKNTSAKEALIQANKKVEEAKKHLETQKYEQEKAVRRAEKTVADAQENIWLLGGGEATSAIQSLERAQMELDIIKKDWARIIDDAEVALKEAEALVETLEKGEEDIEGLQLEEEKVKIAKAQVEECMNQLEDAQYAIQQLQVKYERDKERATSGVEEAEHVASEANTQIEKDAKSQEITEALLQMDIDKKQKTIDEIYEVYAHEGIITSTIDGVVGAFDLEVGDSINSTTLVGIIPKEAQYVFEAIVTEDEAEKLEVGDAVTITLDQQESALQQELIIDNILPVKEGEGKKITVQVENIIGESSGSLNIKKDSKTYQSIIPIQAIRQDSEGKFVMVVREEVTTLGTQMIATRVPIIEVERNDKVAAIQGGLTPTDQVIIAENKPVKVGDRIRVIKQ